MFKIKNPGRSLWFSADFHAYHRREFIWKERGFESVQAHADALIELVNTSVAPSDTLFHLGDLTLDCEVAMLRDFLGRIRCRNVVCLWGNHSSPMRSLMREESLASAPEKPVGLPFTVHAVEPLPYRYTSIPNLVTLGDAASLEINNERVYLSHYAHQTWPDSHKGAYHLCGHDHGDNPYSHPDTGRFRVMDVGVNIGWHLWNWEEVRTHLVNRRIPGHSGHHASE